MRLSELHIKRDLTGYHALAPTEFFAKYGWEVIGDGAESAVAEHPDKSYVLKLFASKSKYAEFVNRVVRPNETNPHMPRFGRYVRPVPGTAFSYVRMEALTPVSEHDLKKRYLPELVVLYKLAATHNRSMASIANLSGLIHRLIGDHDGSYDLNDATLWKKLGRKPDTAWFSICETIYGVAKSLRLNQFGVDFHFENFMLRGDTLVITDPFI